MDEAMKNGKTPASPIPYCSGYGNSYPIETPHGWETVYFEGGLTKREEFARSQMAAGRIANPTASSDELAQQACMDADALLRALRSGEAEGRMG